MLVSVVLTGGRDAITFSLLVSGAINVRGGRDAIKGFIKKTFSLLVSGAINVRNTVVIILKKDTNFQSPSKWSDKC